MTADLATGVRAALELFRERQEKAEDESDEDTLIGRYWMGRADTWGEAAGVLEEMTAPPGWPAQREDDPLDLPLPLLVGVGDDSNDEEKR